MSTLLCVSEGRGWWVVVVGGCVVVSSCTTGPLGPWSRPRKRSHSPPHPVLNEKREGAGGHPCRLDISLRSCCGRRGTVAFFTSQYVLVIKKEKIQTKYSILWKGKQLQQERIAAFFSPPSEILAPDSPQRHTECNDWSDKRKQQTNSAIWKPNSLA